MKHLYFAFADYKFYYKHGKIYFIHNGGIGMFADLPLSLMCNLRIAFERSVLKAYIEEINSNTVEQLKLFLTVNCIISKKLFFYQQRNIHITNNLPSKLLNA